MAFVLERRLVVPEKVLEGVWRLKSNSSISPGEKRPGEVRDSSKNGPAWSRSFSLPGQQNSGQHRNDAVRTSHVSYPLPGEKKRGPGVTPVAEQCSWGGHTLFSLLHHSLPGRGVPGLLGTDSTLPIMMPKSQPLYTCAELPLRNRVLGEVEKKSFIAL